MAAAHAYESPRPSLSTASPPRRPRQSTAVARREEKAELLNELEVLRAWLRLRRARQREKRVAEIKQQEIAGASGEEAGAAALVQASTFDARTVAKAATLLRLRSAVRDCHLMVSSVRGQLCAHSATQAREVLYTALTLPADATQRNEALRLCHAQAIRDADEFICARCSGMDLLMPYSSQEQFLDPASGELCAVYLEVTQFPGVQRVQDVFEAVRFWATNLEICVSEQLGDVTIREDAEDDESDEPTSRGPAFSSVRRIRSQLACGVAVGGCQAVFGQVVEDEDYAVTAVQPVDADARRAGHEYEFAGNDIMIRSSVVVRVARVDGVVVLTRWARIAFRATRDHGSVTPLQLRAALTASVGRWFEVFQRVVWEQLAVSVPALQQPLLYDLR